MASLSSLLAELKRRRVFRVAAFYGGIAFVIVQIIDGAFSYLHIPEWFGTAIIVLLLIGFPIAIGLAWAFDITPEGIVRTEGAKREALEAIATGKAGGPIGIFMSTITDGLKVLTASLEFKFDGKNSHFGIGGAIEVAFDPILNPVTGAEHQASIFLPDGMIAKHEDHFSSKTFDVNTNGLSFSYPGHTAIAMQNTWRGP